MPVSQDQELVDALKRCESEPIHLVHAIQPHGYLLAVDTSGEIRLASANVADLTGISADTIPGQPLAQLLSGTVSVAIQQAGASLQSGQSVTLRLDGLQPRFSAYARLHRSDGLLIVELERDGGNPCTPDEQSAGTDSTDHHLIRETLRRLEQESDVISCCRWVAKHIQELTGFDRVMVYRFSENWDGEVIAESGSSKLPEMIGHHFPAADIPPQARALYSKNLIRVLSNSEANPIPIVPAHNPLSGKPLDLSDSALRSISLIHVRYLRNMGVGASLSISLMQGGKLWGLVACHHATARSVPFPVRDAAEIIGRMTSFKLDSLENHRSQDWLARLHETQLKLTNVIRSAQDVSDLNAVLENHVLPLIDGNACLLVIDNQRFAVGALPPVDALSGLLSWLRAVHPKECLFVTDNLSRSYAPAETFAPVAAGMVAIALNAHWKDYLLCFRREIVRDIIWAGNPEKQLSHDEKGVRLNPRHSFVSWVETARYRSLPWDRFATDGLLTVSHSLLTVIAEKSLQSVSQRVTHMKDEFVSNISHEMRTPLHAILSFADIALKRIEGPPEKLAGYLSRIQASGQRLHALIEDLLILTRLRGGMVKIDSRQTNLQAVVESCLEKFATTFKEKDLHTEIALRTERFNALIAPDLIAKMFEKLLSNAVKFSPTNGRITIILADESINREARSAEEIDALSVEILDDGPGIPEDELERIFEQFSQSSRTNTGAGGTGLGLSICREIMTLHGGIIRAENRVCGGTRLVCLIPRQANAITVQ